MTRSPCNGAAAEVMGGVPSVSLDTSCTLQSVDCEAKGRRHARRGNAAMEPLVWEYFPEYSTGFQQSLKVNTGVVAFALEQIDEVFSRHIPHRARGKRTATKAAKRAIKRPYALFQSSGDVRESCSKSIV